MASFEVSTANADQLDAVIGLWKKNKKTLGPYPKGAFEERLQNREIIVALRNGVVVGYVLFYVAQKGHVRLTHLCIESAHGGQGIARALVERLRSQTSAQKGIGLHCRRDFDVCRLWPKLGFVPISEKIGRSKDGSELIYFWLQNSHPTLFSADDEDDRLKVVIDANVFLDFNEPERHGASETAGMMADWLQPLIRICINDELFTEIFRNPNSTQRKDRLSKARNFECLESNVDDFLTAQESVRAILGEPSCEQDSSDQRHLCRTIASDATVFVSRDEPILRYAEDIYQRHGLSIVRPSELVAQFEALRNESQYQRARLAGSALHSYRLGSGASQHAEAFQAQDTGEKQWELESFLNKCFAHPDSFRCHLSEGEHGRSLALYVLEATNGNHVKVPVFRLSRKVRSTRLAPTLARTLLGEIVQNSLGKGASVVRITDQHLSPTELTALRSTGFFKSNGEWLKLSIPDAVTPSEMFSRVTDIAQSMHIPLEHVVHLTDELASPSLCASADRVLAIEQWLWPAKLTGCEVSNFVVSIEPRWASDLFDAGLASSTLWGADTELAVNPDSVYYRAARPPISSPKGRILWYVKADTKISGAKCIRACSQLTAVTVGQPKELFRRFKRLGVYDWSHVLATAGSLDGQLMALEFCKTELFGQTISWKGAREILQKHGVNATFQSPTLIPEAAFLELYHCGVGCSGNKV
jgi:ribosomal protein S18 acetylase RimI-like enzyme